jgi:hypothetical protein
LTLPQKEYFHVKVDQMLAAGVIEQVHPSQVKCVSPTTLVQKAHEGGGLSLEELQHCVNEQCIAAGHEPAYNLPERTTPTPDDTESKEPKWQICQNFGEINKLTEIPPMPQGNIRAKQQRLAGH